MIRTPLLALLLALSAGALAQNAPAPEECLAGAKDGTAIVVTHAGQSYRLTSEACRTQFLGDPERYAQLYDALLALSAEGRPVAPPRPASLVPS